MDGATAGRRMTVRCGAVAGAHASCKSGCQTQEVVVQSRVRLIAALLAIAVAAVCLFQGAEPDAPAPEAQRVAVPIAR